MQYANIKTAICDTAEFVRSKPVVQATWLKLLIYCVKVENSGRIVGCARWGNESWKLVARVYLREVRLPSRLWEWDGDDLIVRFYPLQHEQNYQEAEQNGRASGRGSSFRKLETARANGRLGGRPRKICENPNEIEVSENPNNPITQDQGKITEGKEIEGNTTQVQGAAAGGKRLHGIPSSVDEVIAYGRTLTPPQTEAVCRAFGAHYEGQARQNADGNTFWITSGEAVVTNWRAKLPAFGGIDASRKNSGRAPSRNAGTTNENKPNQYADYSKLLPPGSNTG